MTVHVLVEGPSERAFLDRWISRLIRDQRVRVHPHQGKGSLPAELGARPDAKRRGLLDQLPATLRGLADSPHVDGVLVLLDADDDDVTMLKTRIKEVADICAPQLHVRISVAVEETEAFYLGDLRALQLAYPDADLDAARSYVPDSICGTWELFGVIVGDDGGNKVAWAEAMGPRVTTRIGRNRSPSFNDLLRDVTALAPPPKPPTKRRTFRHSPKTAKRGKGPN